MKKISDLFKNVNFKYLEQDVFLSTNGTPNLDFLLKIEEFISNFESELNSNKLHYPAYYVKGKNGAYVYNMCLEPSFNTECKNYAHYNGSYLDFNFRVDGDSYIDFYINNQEIIRLNKNNINLLFKETSDLKESLDITSCIESTISELEDWANLDVFIDEFEDKHSLLDLRYLIIKKLNEKEKNIILNFIKSF